MFQIEGEDLSELEMINSPLHSITLLHYRDKVRPHTPHSDWAFTRNPSLYMHSSFIVCLMRGISTIFTCTLYTCIYK